MKNLIKKIIVLLFTATVFVSCTTMNPAMANVSFPAAGTYEILGRVTLEADMEKSGFEMLLNKAQEEYPEADDVVNIIVDKKFTTLFYIIPISQEYVMSGMAISYND